MNKIKNEGLSGFKPLVFGAIIFLVPCVGFGPFKDNQHSSLAGVEQMQVVVRIGLSRAGPTPQLLQEEVKKQLMEAGIHIVPVVDNDVPGSVPIFYVEVAVWQNGMKPYVYFVKADLYQTVQLDRKNGIKVYASTWQTSLIGEGTIERIRHDVSSVAKKFAVQYTVVNQG